MSDMLILLSLDASDALSKQCATLFPFFNCADQFSSVSNKRTTIQWNFKVIYQDDLYSPLILIYTTMFDVIIVTFHFCGASGAYLP
jgi:hypothetical protein